MKILLTLALSLTVLAGNVRAAETFEGRITMKLTSGGKSNEVAYATKGSRMRMEMNAEGKSVVTLLDLKEKEMIMLMPDQKMYMVMPLRDVPGVDKVDAAAADTTLEKTSETETILGYKTTKYIARSKEQKEPVEIWAAEGLGSFFNPSDLNVMGAKRKAPLWEKELREKGFFPLRIVTKQKKGREDRMEVIKLDKTALPESLFVPPADFKKFSLPGLGGLIPGMGGKN